MNNLLPPEVYVKLGKLLERSTRISNLSDAELSNLNINKVWGSLIFGSEEEMLLDELIRRFDKGKGIERGDDGEVVK